MKSNSYESEVKIKARSCKKLKAFITDDVSILFVDKINMKFTIVVLLTLFAFAGK